MKERELFKEAVRRLIDAYEQRGDQPPPQWPKSLRVKDVEGAARLFALTWSFSGPDGRATFELVTIDGEPAIRWRRIGGQRIFDNP